jgi:DNA-binding transcriptional ArsR family regulator
VTDRVLDVTDPVSLRALAHPLRLRLLRLVRAHRPVTGAELAALTGESTASVSYHLSVLARHGFIEPDPAPGATRRHRPWRTTFDRMRMSEHDSAGSPLESPGGAVLASLLAGARAEQDAYLAGESAPEGSVADAAVFQLSRRLLTAAQAETLSAEVTALLDRYRNEGDPGPGEAAFSVTFVAVPTTGQEVPR